VNSAVSQALGCTQSREENAAGGNQRGVAAFAETDRFADGELDGALMNRGLPGLSEP
jgi:hypothetical protein